MHVKSDGWLGEAAFGVDLFSWLVRWMCVKLDSGVKISCRLSIEQIIMAKQDQLCAPPQPTDHKGGNQMETKWGIEVFLETRVCKNNMIEQWRRCSRKGSREVHCCLKITTSAERREAGDFPLCSLLPRLFCCHIPFPRNNGASAKSIILFMLGLVCVK